MRRTHPGTSVCNCYHISRPFRAIPRNSAVFPEFFNFHKCLIVVANVSNKDVFEYDRNPISHALVKSNIRFVDNDDAEDERNLEIPTLLKDTHIQFTILLVHNLHLCMRS